MTRGDVYTEPADGSPQAVGISACLRLRVTGKEYRSVCLEWCLGDGVADLQCCDVVGVGVVGLWKSEKFVEGCT